jgi:HNH endonuclease
VPRSRGGRADVSNYQLLCWHCNGLKGDQTDQEFRIYLPEWRNWFRAGREAGFALKPEANLRTRRWWSVYEERGRLLDPSQHELWFVSSLFREDRRFRWYECEDDDLALVWTREVTMPVKLTRWRWLQVHFKKDYQRLGSQLRYASQLSPRLRSDLIYERAEREERRYQRDYDAVWDMVATGKRFCWYQREQRPHGRRISRRPGEAARVRQLA